MMATIGWQLASKEIKIKSLYIPYYFLFMNVALTIAFRNFLNKSQSIL